MDVKDREEWEKRLARRLGRALSKQLRRLMDALGNPPSVDKVPAEFWRQMTADLSEAIQPEIEKIFLEQAQELMASQPLAVEWGLVNTRAVEWAGQYTFDLVTGLNETTRTGLRRALTNYYENGLTLGDLREELSGFFGPVRADMIATTEITRASAQGEISFADEIRKEFNVELAPIHQTSQDELVCPICGPRHNQQITDGRFPPLHPRCRCFVSWELPEAA
jgi:hypothetical protein